MPPIVRQPQPDSGIAAHRVTAWYAGVPRSAVRKLGNVSSQNLSRLSVIPLIRCAGVPGRYRQDAGDVSVRRTFPRTFLSTIRIAQRLRKLPVNGGQAATEFA